MAKSIPVSAPGAVIHEPSGNVGGTVRGGPIGANLVPPVSGIEPMNHLPEKPATLPLFSREWFASPDRNGLLIAAGVGVLAGVIAGIRFFQQRSALNTATEFPPAGAGDELVVLEVREVRDL